jgi:hypothetical protein
MPKPAGTRTYLGRYDLSMTNNPPDVCNDGRRVAHRDHHVGICHRSYQHRSGLELKHLFNVGHEGTGPNPVPELAGAPVRMASLVEDDAGRPLAPPEDALH